MIDLLQIDYQDGNAVVSGNAPIRFSWRALTGQDNYRIRIFEASGSKICAESPVISGNRNFWTYDGNALDAETSYC